MYIWTKVSDVAILYFEIEHIEDLTKDQLNTVLQIEVMPKHTTSEETTK